jgi:BASS family bile acid:Na+ symporter
MLARFSLLFPLWLLIAVAVSLYHPPVFAFFRGSMITTGLGGIMLFMGLSLRVEDFRRVFQMPEPVFAGLILQYTVMPLSGWTIAKLLDLPDSMAAGLVLVSACPGGTASNVITYLAKGDLALSVTMTAISTMLAIVLTPLLTYFLLDDIIAVDAAGLLQSTFQVIVLPVLAGLFFRRWLPRISARLEPFGPPAAVILIVLIVASIVGQGRARIVDTGPLLLFSTVLLHVTGFGAGYLLSRLFFLIRRREPVSVEIRSRTISIEVGMQNSGLGVVLAQKHFTDPAVALPPAISSVVHSLIGSFLAALWLTIDRKRTENAEDP